MRNKKTLSIIKFAVMLLLTILFIVIAITKRDSFHSPGLFLALLFLMYLDTIIVVWLLFEIKRTFTLKKTAFGLSMFLLGGWIIALVTIFATKSASLIPAEHVFGGIYASLTSTAIILGIYAWISNIAYKQKHIDIDDIDKVENDINEPSTLESDFKVSDKAENIAAKTDNAPPAINARERRKLKRQQKLHNEIAVDSAINDDIVENEQELTNGITTDECKEIREIEQNSNVDLTKTNELGENDSEFNANAVNIEGNQQEEFKEAIDDSVVKPIDDEHKSEPEPEYQASTDNNIDSIESNSDSNDTDISPEIFEVAADAIAVGDSFSVTGDIYSDLSVDNDDALSDEFNRVIEAFNEESDNVPSDEYKPVKINVFENDSVIPSEIEVVKNEFVASGKFVDYSVKDETRGLYEEIENENERKIALMTDLSKVIITSNVNATIVPIEYEILERTFENKLRQSDDDAKEYYSVIKNKMLSFEGVKSRVSKLADTFKCNGEVVCKITVSGKTLLVNLCLDCSQYDAKYYKFVDVGDMSKFADTPMRIKIKNKLTLKRCLEIIDLMFAEKLVSSSAIENIDYVSQYPRVENAVIFMNSIAHLIRRE